MCCYGVSAAIYAVGFFHRLYSWSGCGPVRASTEATRTTFAANKSQPTFALLVALSPLFAPVEIPPSLPINQMIFQQLFQYRHRFALETLLPFSRFLLCPYDFNHLLFNSRRTACEQVSNEFLGPLVCLKFLTLQSPSELRGKFEHCLRGTISLFRQQRTGPRPHARRKIAIGLQVYRHT